MYNIYGRQIIENKIAGADVLSAPGKCVFSNGQECSSIQGFGDASNLIVAKFPAYLDTDPFFRPAQCCHTIFAEKSARCASQVDLLTARCGKIRQLFALGNGKALIALHIVERVDLVIRRAKRGDSLQHIICLIAGDTEQVVACLLLCLRQRETTSVGRGSDLL